MAALQLQSMALRAPTLVVRARWDSKWSHAGKVLGLQSSTSFGSLRLGDVDALWARRILCSAVEFDKRTEVDESSSLKDLEIEDDSEDLQPIVERDFAGTPYISIYVMLPLGTINYENQVADAEDLKQKFYSLRATGVDGVVVDCWWGLVEGQEPQYYNWSGYRQLFTLARDCGLKLQVVMSVHQCGGNVGDVVFVPIPQWVVDIGKENPAIFFTDKQGVRNPERLSWGVNKVRVLRGRTALEVYYDYMRSFREEMDEFFTDGTITEIEVGLGACGELRYPSYPETRGWKYPGIGEFQCYDENLL